MKTKKKSAGPLAGFIFIIIGIGLLWWNEGNVVKNSKTIGEARSVLINVSSDSVDNNNEGKLVSTNGEINVLDEYLVDELFNLKSPKTAKMIRIVEMLQWVEDEDEDSNGNTIYRYEKKWSSEKEDSSYFNDSTKVNPSTMPYNSDVFYANDVSLGAFTLSHEQKELLNTSATVSLNSTINVPSGYYLVGNYISSVSDLNSANVGDIRISFKYNNDRKVSVLGKQKGNSFEPYISKQEKKIFRVESGILTGEEIISKIENENNFFKWLLRFIGIIFNMCGFAALLSPLAFLVKWIPLLGRGISKVIGWIGGLIGLAVSLVVIAISWIYFRPIVALILLGGVVAIVVLIVFLLKKSRKVENNELEVVTQTEQMPINPLEQQQLLATQQASQQQMSQQQNAEQIENVPQQTFNLEQDPMSIFGQSSDE